MSDKCSHHKNKCKKLFRRIYAGVLIALFVVFIVVLLIWAILQPKMLQFVLQDTSGFYLNTTIPNVVTAKFQITVLASNPNDKIGVYYDRISVHATYHDQQITLPYSFPPTYQIPSSQDKMSTLCDPTEVAVVTPFGTIEDPKDKTVWSPDLYGNESPIAPYNGMALHQDQSNGLVRLVIKNYGRVRFKVGAFTSGHYHLHVKCPALITFPDLNNGMVAPVKYTQQQSCRVSL